MNKNRLLLLLMWFMCMSSWAEIAPKREFRGAWIQCVNYQFMNMGTVAMQQSLSSQLNTLQACGINAILFQVRPEFDALYASRFEPWSRYLTGKQGTAPAPYWDPLAWMIAQCHARGMELHAWINPYRAKTKGTRELASTHPYFAHPERYFNYDGQIIMDPAWPENRDYLCLIVTDILERYDVDGIHIDDYFYPYPDASRSPIPDDASYERFGRGQNKDDWRRENVNATIRQLHECIHEVKPWVKFGVSPFGIYRNLKSDPVQGSNTRGLQNYDDLYADVLKWVNEGWVDYNIPQIYWEIGHPAADYDTLIRWWSEHASARPLIVGQDVDRTVAKSDPVDPSRHQMQRKMALQRSLPNVEGSCQWYAKAVVDNKGGYADMLRTRYHRYPALQPSMPWIDKKAPRRVRSLKAVWTEDGYILFWRAPHGSKEMSKARQYVVYRFEEGESVNLNFAENIVAITSNTFYKLPYNDGTVRYTYVVTALDRLQNESRASKEKVRL